MSLFGKNDSKTEHQWVEERLSAYLDGELSSRERNTVEHHLARCQECQKDLRTLRQTIQLTKQLPTVPVPRVFTIPAPARQPARVARRRWSVGLLQGATALVALLLVFAVAGDFVLTGLAPVRESAPVVVKEQSVVDSGATDAAEVAVARTMVVQAEAPAAQASIAAEKSASELPSEAGPATEPPLAAPRAAAPQEPEATAEPTAAPEASSMGGMGFEPPAEETQAALVGEIPGGEAPTGEAPAGDIRAGETPGTGVGGGESQAAKISGGDIQGSETPTEALSVAAAAPSSDTETVQTFAAAATGAPATGAAVTGAADTVEPEANAEPAMPPAPTSGQEPTVVANARPLAQQASEVQEPGEGRGTERNSLITLVQTAEFVLGGAFILLATGTIVVMLRRRRAR